jgi:hypothetical protein
MTTQHKDLVDRLEFEPVRSVFKDEARHFTTWMEQHIDVLADRLGLELNLVQREQVVGDFNVDLLCEDAAGRVVIVENQLEKTDHDHLGKLLTYLVNLDASTAIWVTTEPRPEHQKVIDWLNEYTSADLWFYLVKLETVRIGESPPAPLFTILAGPDSHTKDVGEKKKEWAERHVKRMEFWKGLLEMGKGKTKLFANISPSTSNWIATGAGRSGISFNYVILMDKAEVELYIDYDQDTGAKNKAIFDGLYTHKAEIEQEFGAPLEWQRLDDKRASRIRKTFTEGGLLHPESWQSLQDRMIEAMIRLNDALRGRLAKIDVQ